MPVELLYPGNQHPAQAPFYVAVVFLWWIIFGTSMILFWVRRKRHPIRGRFPKVSLFASFCLTLWMSMTAFQYNIIPQYTQCGAGAIAMASFNLCLECYFMRAFALYISFQITSARLEHLRNNGQTEKHKWLNRAHWIKDAFLIKLGMSIGIVLTVSATFTGVVESQRDVCNHDEMEIYAFFVLSMFGFSFLAIAVKLQKCGVDGFAFKSEMKTVGISALIGSLTWVLVAYIPNLADLNRETFSFVNLFAFAAGATCMTGSIIMPLIYSYKFQKYGSIHRTSYSMSHSSPSRSPSRSMRMNPSLRRISRIIDEEFFHFLALKEARDSFRLFLAREFSVENLAFWEAVQHYRDNAKSKGDDKTKARAVEVAQKFIIPDSPMEVNLRDELRSPLLAHLGLANGLDVPPKTENVEPSPKTIFDGVQQEIYELMARDSFRRYKRSSLFKTFKSEGHIYFHV